MPGLSIEELIAEMKKVKKKEHFFVYSPGKDAASCVIHLSKKKLPATLIKDTKKETGVKALGGMVRVEDKKIVWETEQSFTGAHQKMMIKLMKAAKMAAYEIEIRGESEDGDDEGGGGGSGGGAKADDGDREKKKKELEEMNKDLDKIMAAMKL